MGIREAHLVRPAGLLERYHITRHFLGLDSCVLCAARYNGPLELDTDTIIHALKKVVENHAALGLYLIGESSSQPSFGRLTSIDLSKVVETLQSDDLQAVFEEQFLKPFDTKAKLPLWRVGIMKNNYVCFAWHHSIGDGLSGLAFHRALLQSLRQLGPFAQGEAFVQIPKIFPTPIVEAQINLSPSWRKVAQEIFELFAPTYWTRGASAWTGNPVRTEISLKTHVRFIVMTPEKTKEFLSACRSNKATLTSALHVLTTSVLSKLISDKQFKSISSYVPVSLRNLAGTSSDVFCEHVSALHTYPPINANFSWADASQFALFLRSSDLKAKEEIGMLKFLFGQYAAYFRGKLGKKRQGGLELSNLGHFDIGEMETNGAPWTIGSTFFAQCDALVGAALKLNCVGDPLGGVTVTVTWGEGSVPLTFGESFVTTFEEELRKLTR